MIVGEQAVRDASFRWVLLHRCQKEFTKDKKNDKELEKRKQEVEAAPKADKKKLELELNLAIAKAKRRSVGNIRLAKHPSVYIPIMKLFPSIHWISPAS